jgi:hypothetical protein
MLRPVIASALLILCGCSAPAPSPVRPEPTMTNPPATGPAVKRASGTGAGSEYDGVTLIRTAAATSDLPATLAIDPTRVIRPATPLLFGTNQAWLPQEPLMAGGPGGAPLPAFMDLARGLPMPLNRMAGSDSAFYRWQWAIGPMESRKAFPDEYKRAKVRTLGPVEWVQTVLAIDPTARFTWTFNCLQEEPEDHAALVEFLTGRPGENRDGGVDWAARRVELGLAEPVKVAIWEIGNETDHGTSHQQRFPDAAAYAAYAKRTIAAVRRVDPQAPIGVHAFTGPWSKPQVDWKAWHRTVLTEVGSEIDWLIFHPYYCGLPIAYMERHLDVLRDDIQRLGGGRAQLYLSEHARWPEEVKGQKWSTQWYHTHSLGGCLATGQFLARMLNRPDVGAAAYHALTAGPWGLFYDRDFVAGKPVPVYATGMADLLRFLAPLHQGQVVSTTLAGERTASSDDHATAAAAAVLRPDGRLAVLVTNREATAARPLTINLGAKPWRLAGGNLFTADGLDQANAPGLNAIRVLPIAAASGPLTTFTVPAHSAALLTLEP